MSTIKDIIESMRYVKTEQELIEGKRRKQELQNAYLRQLFDETFYEDCTFLLRGMRSLMDEEDCKPTVNIPVLA